MIVFTRKINALESEKKSKDNFLNKMKDFTKVLLFIFFSFINVSVFSQVCGTSGLDGPQNAVPPVNTYFPLSTTATLTAGSKTIMLNAVPPNDPNYNLSYGLTPIKSGDLILIIQMQDASFNYLNSNLYGSGLVNSGPDNLGGTGFTSLNNSGKFEYVVATSDVPITGGVLKFRGAGVGKGCVNTYTNSNASTTEGQKRFQVVRVPQYSNLVLTANITTPPYNGSVGGLIAFDVAGTMQFNGFIVDASARGFRGGYGPKAASNANNSIFYVGPSSSTTSVGKGEGIGGTPRYMWDGFNQVVNGSDGLPGGSYGRGAPANGGGGGNDHNAGGGGGGNGGYGGLGGMGWQGANGDVSPLTGGGRPGSLLPIDYSRLIMGGGGGGGDANDALTGVTGGVGGGIILINVEKIIGNGVVKSNGGNGAPGIYGSAPDGAGGGGAGGSIFMRSLAPSLGATLTLEAKGGRGGNTLKDDNNEHGPGGGGGGGFIYTQVASATIGKDVSKGLAGKANNGAGIAHGASDGTDGQTSEFTTADLPVHLKGGGSICYPVLTTTLTEEHPGALGARTAGGTATYTLTIQNAPTNGNAGNVEAWFRLPSSFKVSSIAYALTGDASGTLNAAPHIGASGVMNFGNFNISPGDKVVITIVVDIAINAPTGIYHASAQATYLDPTRTQVNPYRKITAAKDSFNGFNATYETGGAGNVSGENYNGDLVTSIVEDVHINAAAVIGSCDAITGGGFETYTVGEYSALDKWGITNSGDRIKIVNQVGLNGAVIKNNASEKFSLQQTVISIEPSTAYTLTFNYRNWDVCNSSSTPKFYVEILDANTNQVIAAQTEFIAGNSPDVGTVSFVTLAGTTSIILKITAGAPNSDCGTFIDHISIISNLNITYPTTNVTCNGASDGNVTIKLLSGAAAPYQVSYSFNGGSFSASTPINPINSSGTPLVFDNLNAGSYALKIVDANGCENIKTFSISQPPVLSLSETHIDNSCNNNSIGAIDLTVSGGTAPYTYDWVKDGTSYATLEDISSLPPGHYTVTVTDNNSCQKQLSVDILPLTPFALSGNQVDNTCNGYSLGSITLIPSGGKAPYSYTWSNGSHDQNQIDLPAGTYNVIGKDGLGCEVSLDFTITEPTQLNLSSTKTDILCNGGTSTVTLIATGGTGIYQYSKDGTTFQSSNIFPNLTTGDYTFTVKDANGCSTTTSSITITEPTKLDLTTSKTDILCNGGTSTVTLTATGGTGVYQYSKDGITFQSSNIFSNLTAGNYNFTVKDANGCSIITSSITITEPTKLDLTSTKTDILCNGGTSTVTLTATGGTGVYGYSNDGTTFQASNTFPNLAAGNYTFTVKDANGCMFSTPTQINITEPTKLDLTTSKIDILCNGGTSTVTLTAIGGTGVYGYSKDGITFQSSNIFLNLTAGNYNFTVKDANGCSTTTSSITIAEPTKLDLSSTNTDILCNSGTSTVTLTATGGAGVYQYSKDGITFQSSNILSNLTAGDYTFIVKDANGCTFTTPSQITITEPTKLDLTTTKTDILCNGGTSTVTLTATGGTSVYGYSKDGTTFQASNTFPNLAAGIYTFTVKDANGCMFSTPTQINITEPTKLDLTISKTDILCNGGTSTVTLTVTGGTGVYGYSKDGTTFQASNIFNGLTAGDYTFTVKDANGCTFTTSSKINITEPTKLDLSSTKTDILCNGGTSTVTLSATGGTGVYGYSKDGITFQTSNIFSNLTAGNYTFTVKDANDCTFTIPSSINITEPTQLSLSSTKTDILCNGGTSTVTLAATGGTGVYGYSKDGTTFQASNTFSNLTAGDYTFTVKDANGCTFTTPTKITITEPTKLNLSSTKTDILCNGGTSTVTVTATGGNGVYQYSKDGIAFQSSNVFSGLLAGNYTFTVKDGNDCTFSTLSQITLTEPTQLSLSATNTDILCSGGTSTVTLTATGGTSVYEYSKDGTTFQASNVFPNLTAGNYIFMIKDANGCSKATSGIAITEPTKLDLTTSKTDILCNGETSTITLTATGGTGVYGYSKDGIIFQASNIFSNLIAGDYTFTVKDANGCSIITSSITITEPTKLDLSSTKTDILCNGGTSTVTLTATGGTGVYGYSKDGTTFQTSNIFSNLIAGDYIFTVKDENGCGTTTSSITITEPTKLDLTSTKTDIMCNGGTSTVTLTATGGTGVYGYSKDGTTFQSSNIFSNLTTGDYTFTLKDANGCSTITSSITITEPTKLDLTTNKTDILCNGGTSTVTLTATGGTGFYGYSKNGTTFQGSNIFPNLTAGDYTFTVKDANGCTFTTPSQITVTEPTKLDLSSTKTDILCNGGTSTVTLTATGGTGVYGYSKDGTTFQSSNIFSNLTAGNYNFTVKDANGCTFTTPSQITITEPTQLDLSSTKTNILCNGGTTTVTLAATGGTGVYGYSKDGTTFQASNTFSNLTAGDYTFTVKDANGCTFTTPTQITITEPTKLDLSSTKTDILCNGGTSTVILTATGGTGIYQYSKDGTTFQTSNIFPNLTSGDYNFTVKDANGCSTTTSSITIIEPTKLDLTLTKTDILCNGGTSTVTITATGGTGVYQYSNDGITFQASNIFANLIAGNYTFTVKDANGCSTITSNITITEPTELDLTTSKTDILCNGGSSTVTLTATGGTGVYQYSKNGITFQSSNIFSNLTARDYTFTVKDANGCSTTTSSITITEPTKLDLTTSKTDILCNGGTSTVTLTATGGTGVYGYSKDGTIFQASNTFPNLIAGDYTFIVKDANGCMFSTPTRININEPIKLDLTTSKTDILCNGGTSTVTLTAIGGTGIYQYSKDGITFQSSNIFSNLTAGDYTFTVKDANGCTFTTPSQITITEPTKLDLTTTKTDILCNGGTSTVTLTATGGAGVYQYSKDGITFQSSNILSNLTAGDYTFIVKDANGCMFTTPSQITITEPTKLDLSSTKTDILCNGGTSTVTLTATGGTGVYGYSNDGTTFQTSNIFSNLTAGDYIFTVKDENGCSTTTSSITITEPTKLDLSSTKTDILCNGGTSTVTLNATGGTGVYQYSKGGIAFQSSKFFNGLLAGNYTFTVKDANGCSTITSSITITEPTKLSITELHQDINCFGSETGSINISVSGGKLPYTFLWNNGAKQEDLSSLKKGDYSVIVTDANGCNISKTIKLSEPISPLKISETHQNNICFGEKNGKINIQVSGGTAPYQYKWSTGETLSNLDNLESGTYQVTVIDKNGCSESIEVIINPLKPFKVTENIAKILCYGEKSKIKLNLEGGQAPYKISWSDGKTGDFIDNLIAGDYTYTAKDNYGCSISRTITISQPQPITAKINVKNTSCKYSPDGAVLLEVDGGTKPYQFTWNGKNRGQNNTLINVNAGKYIVNIIDANNCSLQIVAEVLPGNCAPNAGDDFYKTKEDTPITIKTPGVIINDADPDDDFIKISLSSAKDPEMQNGTVLNAKTTFKTKNGSVTLNDDGSFTYTPNKNFYGTENFVYKATDGDLNSNLAVVTIIVEAVNDPPLANNDFYITKEDTPVNASVAPNDSDPENEKLTFTLVSPPINGKLTFNADGTFNYVPELNFNGVISFNYQVCDPQGLCDQAVATITITPVNDPPVALDDKFYLEKDKQISETVIKNDSDPDGDVLVFTAISQPKNGTLTFNTDGTFVYKPNAGFKGIDTFNYRACDPFSLCDDALVTLVIQPIVTVNLTPATGTIKEGDNIDITAVLTESLLEDVNVSLNFSGSASLNLDYKLMGDYNIINIPAGKTVTTQQFKISAILDDVKDDNEIVNAIISNTDQPSYVLIGNGSLVTIKDIYPESKPLGPEENPDINPDPLVSPNGDGNGNETFIIYNISKYPNNEVIIFNRWGNEVYRTKGYDNKGNSFRGVANVGILTNSNKDLVDGVYYYIIYTDQDNKRKLNKGYLILKR